jgi:hypothetical protein
MAITGRVCRAFTGNIQVSPLEGDRKPFPFLKAVATPLRSRFCDKLKDA